MKRIVSMFLFLFIICLLFAPAISLEASDSPTRVINVVYDDSGSMYRTNEILVDTWCQAKYSMEVFAAMLGENDNMSIYYMSDYQRGEQKGPRIVLSGKDGVATNVNKIHNETTTAGNTPFDSVRKAYSDLENTNADEKWLVILTDGEFQGVNGIAEIDDFLAKKNQNVKVMFLGMGPEAAGITENASENIYYVEAKTNSHILNQITNICTRIFNSNRLEVNASSKTFSFDVPMGELIVFAQGANVQISGIKTENGKIIKSSRSPVEVKYSDCDALNYNNQPARDLVGSMASFTDDFVIGNYTVDVSGAETIEIYYKPNIEVEAYLTDENGKEVTDMENLEAGEYTLSFGFVKADTSEKVTQSKLLGNVEYTAIITNNGTVHEKVYTDGDKIVLEEGGLSIDVIANYLDYNRVSTHLDYSIYKNKEITFEIMNNPSYVVKSNGISGNEDIMIKVQIDGKDFSKKQWEVMTSPVVTLSDVSRDFKIDSLNIEKTNEVGVYRLYPVISGEKPSTGTYADCDYKIAYRQNIGNETWSGYTEGTIKMNDARSWLERNRDNIIKLSILFAIVFIILGYLPFIKNYLPKSLKNRPYIKCIPSEPGERRKDKKGSVDKNFFSTIIPYVSQKGIIRYVPKGVTGAPPLVVKAIKRRRMAFINVNAFAGKEYITFDGEVIKKDCKKFETGAAVTICVKRGEWTYVCSPNQSNK